MDESESGQKMLEMTLMIIVMIFDQAINLSSMGGEVGSRGEGKGPVQFSDKIQKIVKGNIKKISLSNRRFSKILISVRYCIYL